MRIGAALIIVLAVGGALPVAAQPDPSQMLQGLLSGNRGQDQAVRDAYERGYRHGREDERHADRGPPPGSRLPGRSWRLPVGAAALPPLDQDRR